MFMRFLNLKLNPEFIEKFLDFYQTDVLKELQKTDGCLFAGLIKSNPAENEFVSVTFWSTLKKAEEYENSRIFSGLLNRTKEFLPFSSEWKIQLSDNMELEYTPSKEEPVVKKYSPAEENENSENLNFLTSQMFVRILYLKIRENKAEEFKKIYYDTIVPEIKSTKGCINIFLSENLNSPNEFVSVTLWDNKQNAREYETGGKFDELVKKVRHTFSQFYLWKMTLEDDYKAKVKTSDDLKVEHYSFVTGKSFS